MGVPHSLGNLAWGCQILEGAKSTVTPAPGPILSNTQVPAPVRDRRNCKVPAPVELRKFLRKKKKKKKKGNSTDSNGRPNGLQCHDATIPPLRLYQNAFFSHIYLHNPYYRTQP